MELVSSNYMGTISKETSQVVNPFVSVIVPVYNDAARISSCIEALLDQTYPSGLYEILIVDNGSDDGTADVVRRYPVKLLFENSKRSSYAARNKGLAHAQGEVIAFTDADCIPWRDWIEKGVAKLNTVNGCGIVGGRIDFFFKKPERPNAVELYDSMLGIRQKQHIEDGKYGATANIFTFKSVIEHAGSFNESLKSGGDSEWGRRVYSLGYKVIYADDVTVAHPTRNSLKALYRRLTRLTGGNYSQRKSNKEIVKLWIRGTKNSLSVIVRTVLGTRPADSVRGPFMKMKLILIIAFTEVVRNYERVRLVLGGEPKR